MAMRLTVRTKSNVLVGQTVKYLVRSLGEALSEAAGNGAIPIMEEAQAVVHVDTGALRDSIRIQALETTTTRATVGIGPGAEIPYARRIEFGFIGVDSLGRHYNQQPYPYMRPAFDAKKDEAAQAIKDSLREAIVEALVDATNQVAAERNSRG